MGTTLTGTTPQDTYDSLIKVTDNGPLTGSLKKLTDGLGNDSSLSLSTTAASLSGTLAVTGAVTAGNNTNVQATSTNTRLLVTAAGVANTILGFNNSGSTQNGVVNNAGYVGILQDYPLVFTIADGERMRITNTGNVGIGTSSPVARLDAVAAEAGTYTTSTQQVVARFFNSPPDLGSGVNSAFLSFQTTSDGGNANPVARIGIVGESYGSNNGSFVVATRDGSGVIEKMRITSDGYLRLATGGIQFNGDTAAANALDDYEEGTWTIGVEFGGASVGVTTDANTGSYTKIGRQVTVNGFLALSNKGSSTGSAKITGLPFTIPNNDANYSSACLRFDSVSFTNQFQGFGAVNTTTINLQEITILGAVSSLTDADFVNNSAVIISFTYFV
jgi:hypothetical protein